MVLRGNMVRVVNLGEYIVSRQVEDTVRTYSLASCVGVVAYCPACKMLGMAHVVLPGAPPAHMSSLSERMKYAEVLVPAMFKELNNNHDCKDKDSMRVYVYGGIDSISNCVFRIGERNLDSVMGVLRKMNIPFDATNCRGNVYRSLIAYVDTGHVEVIEGNLRCAAAMG